jgi:hypothetical protein
MRWLIEATLLHSPPDVPNRFVSEKFKTAEAAKHYVLERVAEGYTVEVKKLSASFGQKKMAHDEAKAWAES